MEDINKGRDECGSDERRPMYCDPCKTHDNRLAIADTFCHDCKEYLCPQCKHFHTKFQATQNHSLSAGYVPQKKETKELLLKLCDMHKTSEVKFYCHGHKCVLCTICKASIHSGCKVQPITEIIQEESDKQHLTLTRNSITELIENFQNSIDISTNLMTDIERVVNEYKFSLSSVKERMNSLLDQAIINLSLQETEIKTVYAEKTQSDKLSVFSDAVDDLQTVQKNIQAVLDSNDNVAVFSANLKATRLCEEYSLVKREQEIQSKMVSVDFTQYKKLINAVEGTISLCEAYGKPATANHGTTERITEEHMHHESQMSDNADDYQGQLDETHGRNIPLIQASGEIEIKDIAAIGYSNVEDTAAKSPPKTNDTSEKLTEKPSLQYSNRVKSEPVFANMRLTGHKMARVKVASDKNPCDITGSVFLPDGKLVLCDRNNMSVKILNQSFEMIESFKMDSKPWDVAVTAENEVAMTLTLGRVVQFLKFDEDKVKKLRLFQVKEHVWGIDSFGDTLVIALHDLKKPNGAIAICKHNGVVIREIRMNSLKKPFFRSPHYVTVDQRDGKIFVSDGKKNAIMCFNHDGSLVRNYENAELRWPRKIISDLDNNLLICSQFSDSLKYLSLTNNLRPFLKNCAGPQTVSYRDSDQVLAIGRNLNDEILLLRYECKCHPQYIAVIV